MIIKNLKKKPYSIVTPYIIPKNLTKKVKDCKNKPKINSFFNKNLKNS